MLGILTHKTCPRDNLQLNRHNHKFGSLLPGRYRTAGRPQNLLITAPCKVQGYLL